MQAHPSEGAIRLGRATGGVKTFEHQWGMRAAFELLRRSGRHEAKRTHQLARQLKEGLRGMAHVRL